MVLRDVWQAVEDSAGDSARACSRSSGTGARSTSCGCGSATTPELTGDVDALAGRLGEAVRERTGCKPVLDLRTEEDLLKTMTSVAKFPRVVKS